MCLEVSIYVTFQNNASMDSRKGVEYIVCTMGIFITLPPNLIQFFTESPYLVKDVWNTSNCICWRETTIVVISWSSFLGMYFWCKVVRCEVR